MTPSRFMTVMVVVLGVPAGGLAALTWWNARQHQIEREAADATGGLPAAGLPVMIRNGCAGCHTITGVPGAQGLVGPRLDASLAQKTHIGGVLPNSPENMIRWLREARAVDPHTAMPSTAISEQEARDVAAYLYSLR